MAARDPDDRANLTGLLDDSGIHLAFEALLPNCLSCLLFRAHLAKTDKPSVGSDDSAAKGDRRYQRSSRAFDAISVHPVCDLDKGVLLSDLERCSRLGGRSGGESQRSRG
jgi:hypothetical protein